MPPSIDDAEISRIAGLARLKLADDERARYRADLAQILDHFATLRALDTESVPPTSHAIDVTNVFRDDEPGATLEPGAALANAPERDGPYFSVPRVLDQVDA